MLSLKQHSQTLAAVRAASWPWLPKTWLKPQRQKGLMLSNMEKKWWQQSVQWIEIYRSRALLSSGRELQWFTHCSNTASLCFTDTRGAAEPRAAQGADSQNIPNSRGVNWARIKAAQTHLWHVKEPITLQEHCKKGMDQAERTMLMVAVSETASKISCVHE